MGLAGPRAALLADAATFLASAALVRARVGNRPAAAAGSGARAGRRGDLAAGIRLVFGHRSIRTPMLLAWISAFYNVPEGLAAPLARSFGGGPVAVRLILATAALGSSAGAWR